MTALPKKPELHDYLDAAQFLGDVFLYRKSLDAAFSLATWSQELGLSNKTILRFILRRERRISANSSKLFSKNLKLTEFETQYFETLVSYSQASSNQDKQAFAASLLKLQRQRYQPLEVKPSQKLNSAISPVILTLLAFRDVVGSVDELSRLLKLSVDDVSASLEELLESGLIRQTADGFEALEKTGFRIPDKPGDSKLRLYHEYWIEQSKAAIELDPKIRKFRALKFALSEDEFQAVLDRINDFAIALLATYNSPDLGSRRLYMLETLLFPIANLEAGKLAEQSVKPTSIRLSEPSC